MMKKKGTLRICIVSLSTYPLFNPHVKKGFGGAEVQLYLLGKELAKSRDVQVSYIVGDFGQRRVERFGNITIWRSIDKYFTPPPGEKLTAKLVRKVKKWTNLAIFLSSFSLTKPDVIIMRSASAGVGQFRFYSKILRSKFVYMAAHEIDCSGEYERCNPSSAQWYRYGLTKADLVIVQNQEQKDMMRKNYGIESVLLKSSYPIRQVGHAEKNSILWVGRCEDWKRPELFLKLARDIPEQQFEMVAPPALNKETYYQRIRREAETIKNLKFYSLVPFGEIDKFFARARLLVITSRYEGFPNTLVQAAKNKTPIVSLSVNPGGVFDEYKLGFYAHNNYDVMMEFIKEILEDRNKYESMSRSAFNYAKSNHDISKNAQLLKRMLYKVKYGS